MDAKNHILVVSGTPGTGKTRFASLLAKRLCINWINLTEFVRQRSLIKSYDRARRTYVIDERKLRRELERQLIALDLPVILEGHYSGRVAPMRFVEKVFVLRCSPETLRTRLKRRGYSKRKIRENVQAEILDVCLSESVAAQGRRRIVEIDTTAKTAESCVKEALSVLAGKKPSRIGECDWLNDLDRKGRLEEFLKEQSAT